MEHEEKELTCEELTDDLLLDYDEGELPVHMQTKVHAHLESCEKCRVRAQDVGAMSAAFAESRELSKDVPVPGRVDDAVFGTIAEVSRIQRRAVFMSRALRWAVPVAAGVLVVVFAGIILTSFTGHSDKAFSPLKMERAASDNVSVPVAKAPQKSESFELLSGDAGKLKEEKEKLEKMLAEALEREKEYKEQVSKADAASKELADLLKIQKEKNEELSGKLLKSESGYYSFKETLAELERKLAEALEDNRAVKGRLSELEKKLEGKEKVIEAVKSEHEKLGREIEKTRKQNDLLKKFLLVEGDVNGDGVMDVSDALALVEGLLSGRAATVMPKNDVNGDGKVDVGDALSILNRALAE